MAIIDNGANKFRQSICECIERGISYVKADYEDADSGHRILPLVDGFGLRPHRPRTVQNLNTDREEHATLREEAEMR